MKALRLKTGLIMKERCRYLDRQINSVVVIFAVRMELGTSVTQELVDQETDIEINITKKDAAEIWPILKDASIEDVVNFIMANKDFVYLRGTKATEANEIKYQKIKPFYSNLFPFVKQYPDIEIVEI